MANFNIPSCFDRADGTNGYGTAPKPGSVIVNYTGINGITITNGYHFEEYSDSPEIESGEQSTIVHRFNTDFNTAQTLLLTYPRGTVLLDKTGVNRTRVLSTKMVPVAKTNAQVWTFTMTCEAQTFGTPPDEFDVQVVELNPAAEKHPRYALLTYNERYLVKNAESVDSPDFAQQYINAVQSITDVNHKNAALELLNKKHKGEDSFYLSAYKITWSSYYWAPQILNPGGYIQDPIYTVGGTPGGGLPASFWSTSGTPDGTNIFSQATAFNQNMFPTPSGGPPFGLSWLRQSDEQHLERTWFRLSRTWIGAPLGNWDNEWYNQFTQPYQPKPEQGGVTITS